MKKPRTYWDTFNTTYQMGNQKHREYLLDLLKDKGVRSILDVGCGTGPIYQMIEETGENINNDFVPRWDFDYKGTDYSYAMIDVCKKEFPEGDFQVEDARGLEESDNSWECVLLLHALDHLDDYKAAIKEAARVSSKYVCIVLWRSFVDKGTNLNDRNMYGKEPGEAPWEDTHLQEYSRQALQEAFDEAGLKVVKEVDGEPINSDHSHYNYLFLLEK